MAVDIKVNLDIDIQDGIQKIKSQIKEAKQEVNDSFDLDLDGVDDLDDFEIPDEKTTKVSLERDDESFNDVLGEIAEFSSETQDVDVKLNKTGSIRVSDKNADVNLFVVNETAFKEDVQQVVDDADTSVSLDFKDKDKEVDVNLGIGNYTKFKKKVQGAVDDADTDVTPELDASSVNSIDTDDIDSGSVDIEPVLAGQSRFRADLYMLLHGHQMDVDVGGDFSSFYGKLGAAQKAINNAGGNINVGASSSQSGSNGGSSGGNGGGITKSQGGDIKRKLTHINGHVNTDFGSSDFATIKRKLESIKTNTSGLITRSQGGDIKRKLNSIKSNTDSIITKAQGGGIKRRLTNLKKAVKNSQPRKVTNWRKMRGSKNNSSSSGGNGNGGGGGGNGFGLGGGGGGDDDLDGVGGKTKRVLGKLVPTFAGLYQAVAILLPAILGAATQLAGLAVAAGGGVAAAAAPAVLGLLGGSADSLEGSVAQMEQRVKDMKGELFGIFEPVFDTFTDDTGRVFSAIIENAGRLTDELSGLDMFTGLGIGVLEVLTSGVEDVANVFMSMGSEISKVTMFFANLLATKAPEFLRFLMEEGVANIDTLGALGALVVSLADFFYSLFVNVLNVAAIFAGLIPVINKLTAFFENKLVQSVITVIGGLLGIAYVVSVLSSAFMGFLGVMAAINAALLTTGIASTIVTFALGGLETVITVLLVKLPYLLAELFAISTALGLIATLATLATAGLAAVGGAYAIGQIGGGIANSIGDVNDDSMGGRGNNSRFGANGGGDTTINIAGNADDAAVQRILDVTEGSKNRSSMSDGQF